MTKRINYSNNCVKEVFFILVSMKTWNTNIMLIAKLNQLMRIINMNWSCPKQCTKMNKF